MNKNYSLYPLTNSSDITGKYATFQNITEFLEDSAQESVQESSSATASSNELTPEEREAQRLAAATAADAEFAAASDAAAAQQSAAADYVTQALALAEANKEAALAEAAEAEATEVESASVEDVEISPDSEEKSEGSGLDNTLILLIVLAVIFYKLRK